MKNTNIEERFANSRFSAPTGDSRQIIGYALTFDSESEDLGGFTEIISSTALDNTDFSDVKAWLNHNPDRGILARSKNGKGSLQLTTDKVGLKYAFSSPNSSIGDELLEGLKRSDITQSSFAFTVPENGDTWEKRADGTYLRTINIIDKLYDVSPVYDPAYSSTSVTLAKRSLEDVKKLELEKYEKYWNELIEITNKK